MKLFKWLAPGAFANEYFTSYGGGKDGGGSAPDYTPMAQASEKAAEIGAQLGREQLAEGKRQYDLNYQTLQPLVQESIKTQQLANQQGAQNYANYQAEGRSTQQAMLYDALGLNADEIAQYNNMRSQAINTGKASWQANQDKSLAALDAQIANYNDQIAKAQATQKPAQPQYFRTADGRLITADQAFKKEGASGDIFSGMAYRRALGSDPGDGSVLYAIDGGEPKWAKPFSTGSETNPQVSTYQSALAELQKQRAALASKSYDSSAADTSAASNYLAQVTQAAKQRQLSEAADTAMADSRNGTTQQMNQLVRQGLRYGWSPDKLAAMAGSMATGNAQNQVAAANAARTQADAKRTAKLGDVYNTYAGAMSSAPNFYNSGSNAAQTGTSAQLGTSNQLLNNMNSANGTTMQGQGLRVQGLGSVLNAQTSAYNNSQGGSMLGGLLGAGAQLGSAYLLASSDRRMKENIKLVGVDEGTGFNLYEFSYKGDTRRFIGVMADEVEPIKPSAVAYDDMGFASVNYEMLGLEMREVIYA